MNPGPQVVKQKALNFAPELLLYAAEITRVSEI